MDNPTLIVTRPGGTEVLRVEDRARPVPGVGELLVEVEAAGVNFIDIYQREGVYPTPTPFALGQEGAGVVRAVGPGVSTRAVGDRVAWPFVPGSAARWVRVPASGVVTVPESVSTQTAAAAMLQGLTAHYLITSVYAVQPGDLALVHAAAGGVGQLLVQWVRARGGRVIATAGGPEKCGIAAALGAERVIDYRATTDVTGDIRAATGGQGVAVAYDGVGRDTFEASLASLRPRGMLALFGAASGQVPPLDLQRLNAGGSLFVTRPSLPHYLAGDGELAWRSGELFAAMAAGELRVSVGARYPLTDAATAYADLAGRRTQGKLLLIP